MFSRSLKSIPLTAQVKAMLGVSADALAPTELINAILKADAELLYLGGIGTYVKARHEANTEVGDKANDALRVNGAELRVKVVGEGANLGLTQAGRIEYARAGGRIDTDAIDNSAGVDTSDHEVNIKILTGMLERTGHLTRKRRDTLLKSMTDDVGRHVLRHNYDQTLALSLMEMDAAGRAGAAGPVHVRAGAPRPPGPRGGRPARRGGRRRTGGGGQGSHPPGAGRPAGLRQAGAEARDRRQRRAGRPLFRGPAGRLLPKALRKHGETMRRHRLRRDIIATVVANDAINRCGPSFPSRLIAAAGCDAVAFTAGYEAAKTVLDIPAQWEAVAALDGKIPAAGQMALFRRLSAALRGAAFWLARGAARERLDVGGLVHRYGPGFKTLTRMMPEVLSPIERAQVQARLRQLVEAGAPENLARAAAILPPLTTAGDLVDMTEASSWPLPNVARLYHAVGEVFAFDRVRQAAGAYAVGDAFERVALRRLIEDLLAQQTELAHAVMAFTGGPQCGEDAEAAHDAATSWAALRRDKVDVALHTIAEIEASAGVWTFAKLTIANAALRELAEAAKKKR